MTNPVFWPIFAAAVANQTTAAWLADLAQSLEHRQEADASALQPWTTPNAVALDLQTVRLRDFSLRPTGSPVIICAPFALHCATIADFAPDHSIVQRLQLAGVSRVYVTDWRTATPQMRFLSIDNYLADLNVAIDSLEAPVDLVGLCQGGWLAAVYAARFPNKVRRLVLAGAPVDIEAGKSQLSDFTSTVPITVFQGLIDASQGLVRGNRLLEVWPASRNAELLQVLQYADGAAPSELPERLRGWLQQTVDLPGVYYLQAVQWLFKENRIAKGEFVALGRKINLGSIRIPVFVLAGADDEVIAPAQLLAVNGLIGTPARDVVTAVEPAGHLALFVGRRVLAQGWSRVGQWLLGADEAMVDLSQGPVAKAF